MPDSLQGRIIALELLVRGLIVDKAMNQDSPDEYISQMRDCFLANVNLFAGSDKSSQKLILEAENAIRMTLDHAELRIENIQSGNIF